MNYISICVISWFMLFMFSVLLFFVGLFFLMINLTVFIEWEIISLNSLSLVMTMLFDWMTFLFMAFVLFISSLVIFFSKEYMLEDKTINRFIMLVLMFVCSMMLLIISPNLVSILLGWDGLGLVSYCLVIYFQNVKSYNAGMLTALSNRIGDVALLLAIAWMLNFGSWNYVFYLEVYSMDNCMLIIGSLVILAALTKSAQIPFSSWLPAAMAAPTPVSALVHSSTLVTAGVYILIRFNVSFVGSNLGSLVLLISCVTMFMAGLGANFEFDLKKIIALSTLSQLGLMMSILALGFYKLAFFHLLTHALFKALLFMCAGCIIHNMGNFQDIRVMGALSVHMPMTSMCFNIANLALCGMPFLAGFYSKDLILEVVSISYLNLLVYFLYYISTGLTVCYSFRLLFYSMTGEINSGALNLMNDEGWVMLKGMTGLLFMVIMGGSMLNWLIFSTPYMICLPFYMKYMTLSVCMMGAVIGYMISNVGLYFYNKSLNLYHIVCFSGLMWFMPYISTYGIINVPLNLGVKIYKNMDLGWSEYLGSQSLFMLLKKSSQYNQFYQNNNFKIYMLMFILWVFVILLMMLMMI